MIQSTQQKDFNRKTVRSFKKAKAELESVKHSTHEWITFLHKNQQIMTERMKDMEHELEKVKQSQKKVVRTKPVKVKTHR